MYLGAGAFFLITDIVAIIFFNVPFTFFTFSLATVSILRFSRLLLLLSSAATTRALTTTPVPNRAKKKKISKIFFLRNFVSSFDCKCFCGDKPGGVLL